MAEKDDKKTAENNGEATAKTAPETAPETADADQQGAVYDVPVELSAVLGTTYIPVSQLLKMGRGAVLELDRAVGDPIDIYVNERLVARGEVMVVDDRLAVTLTETLKRPSG